MSIKNMILDFEKLFNESELKSREEFLDNLIHQAEMLGAQTHVEILKEIKSLKNEKEKMEQLRKFVIFPKKKVCKNCGSTMVYIKSCSGKEKFGIPGKFRCVSCSYEELDIK